MKWYNSIIWILVIVLLVSIGVLVSCGKDNQADMEEQSSDMESVIDETGKNEDYEKKSLGARTFIIPTPVWVIGSYDKEGKPNVMTAAWVGICCSRPPCVTVSLRKATYTFGNIMEREAFSVNIASESFAKEVAYFGSVSGRNVDKFLTTELTPIKSDLVDAPYIKEFPLVIECKLLQTIELGLHTMFIGEIMDVKADKFILGENGRPDMVKLKPFVFAPTAGFYRTGEHLGDIDSLADEIKRD